MIFLTKFTGISSDIVVADPAKEIDICVHLAGPDCIEFCVLSPWIFCEVCYKILTCQRQLPTLSLCYDTLCHKLFSVLILLGR